MMLTSKLRSLHGKIQRFGIDWFFLLSDAWEAIAIRGNTRRFPDVYGSHEFAVMWESRISEIATTGAGFFALGLFLRGVAAPNYAAFIARDFGLVFSAVLWTSIGFNLMINLGIQSIACLPFCCMGMLALGILSESVWMIPGGRNDP